MHTTHLDDGSLGHDLAVLGDDLERLISILAFLLLRVSQDVGKSLCKTFLPGNILSLSGRSVRIDDLFHR